jgi:hypothetical protein
MELVKREFAYQTFYYAKLSPVSELLLECLVRIFDEWDVKKMEKASFRAPVTLGEGCGSDPNRNLTPLNC